MSAYCRIAPGHPVHHAYHESEYGFPSRDETVLFDARRVRALRASHGGFAAWLDAHHPMDKAAWVKLWKRNFLFSGGEIVGEFLMSLGYLPGAHAADCPVAARIVGAPWQALA